MKRAHVSSQLWQLCLVFTSHTIHSVYILRFDSLQEQCFLCERGAPAAVGFGLLNFFKTIYMHKDLYDEVRKSILSLM